MSRRPFWLPFSLFMTLFPGSALASENFPDTIKTALDMTGPNPVCITCHDTEAGGAGTANRPVGRRVRDYGLRGGDTPMLTNILGKMRDARDDSDGDGKIDVDEIKAGGDPNLNEITGKPPDDYPPPVYGCRSSGVRGTRAMASGGWPVAAAGLLLLRLLRRRVPHGLLARSTLIRARRPLREDIARRRGKGAEMVERVVRLASSLARALARRNWRSATRGALVLSAAMAACNHAPLDVVDGIDLGRFQGRWYEIARLPRATQFDCAGTTASYRLTSDRELVVTNECSVGGLNGVRRQVTASAKVTNTAVPAKLSVDFGGFFGDYWIIDLDRDGYRYAVVGHPTRQYLWILSREPTLDAQALTPILERAAQKGFDTGKLEYTKQQP